MSEHPGVLLRAERPVEREQWLALWQRWPEREVAAHPDYARLFAGPRDVVAAYALDAPGGGVLFPFVLRPVAAEAWAAPDEPAWDLVSPYGYGGAFCWDVDPAAVAEPYWAGFAEAVRQAGVVASFVRLSLFPGQVLPFPWMVAENAPNVVRSLGLDPDTLWYDYEHKVRKNVKRARAAGLTVEIDLTGARLPEFLAIYASTLDRRDAASGYYFSEVFFRSIVHDLAGQFAFFHVLAGQRVVSTELVLASPTHLYSFLGGTLAEAFADRPNDLLKHAVVEWGGRTGRRAYVLGGGYGGPDGIFRYKQSFAPGGVVPFSVGSAVHDPAAVERLVLHRAAFERARGVDWTPRSGYFPPYRS